MIKKLIISLLFAQEAFGNPSRMLLQTGPLPVLQPPVISITPRRGVITPAVGTQTVSTTAAPPPQTTPAQPQTTAAPPGTTAANPNPVTTAAATTTTTTTTTTTVIPPIITLPPPPVLPPPVTPETTASSSTTSAPISTTSTSQTASTTAAPPATTSSTSAAPISTTTATSSTTSAPVSTTAVPIPSTTSAPVSTTAVPIPSTTAAVSTTAVSTTESPTTSGPTMESQRTPKPTMAPLPDGYAWGSWGQACPITNGPHECEQSGEHVVHNTNGNVFCQRPGDCCMCQFVQCGTALGVEPMGCTLFRAGDYGVYGVQQIAVIGDPNSATRGGSIECQGIAACAGANLFADSAVGLECNVDRSCAQAVMQIDNPADYFSIDCNGPQSCLGLSLTINIGIEGQQCDASLADSVVHHLEGLRCNSVESCKDMQITINNRGCNKVVLNNLECMQPESCTGASFQFIGDIDINQCQCGPSCGYTTGLEKCFENLERVLCPDAESCMAVTKTIANPLNYFYLECGGDYSCSDATFNIQLTSVVDREDVTYFEALKFGGMRSGQRVTVVFDNQQVSEIGGVVKVVLDRIECSGLESCQDATFITNDNVMINRIVCPSADACSGCLVKRDAADIGMPCLVPTQGLGPIVPVTPIQSALAANAPPVFNVVALNAAQV
mmetsp:Transcript_1709/g.2782  ORF Transcript_1709/g.2782 Transcript_1709/m.2782 type:complete len:667 (+) Transcript_1709:111-2111(+)